jgi:hypothetical protein
VATQRRRPVVEGTRFGLFAPKRHGRKLRRTSNWVNQMTQVRSFDACPGQIWCSKPTSPSSLVRWRQDLGSPFRVRLCGDFRPKLKMLGVFYPKVWYEGNVSVELLMSRAGSHTNEQLQLTGTYRHGCLAIILHRIQYTAPMPPFLRNSLSDTFSTSFAR